MNASDYTLPESVEIRAESSLPTALDTERGILGCILLNNLHLADAMAICHIEDFALDSHRVILRRMIAMESASMAIDYLTLTAELSRNREIESVGGYAYIASLTEGLPNRLNISEYADEIVEKSMRRQTIVLGSELARRATDSVETSSELLAWANNRTTAICEHIEQASLESQSDDEFELLMKQHHGETALFLPSGIDALDRHSGGYARGEMTVIGGRPQQGKSCMLAQAVVKLCLDKVPCHVFSIEMRSGQLLRRIWSRMSGVPFWKLRRAEMMNETELSIVRAAMRQVSRWPLIIDDGSNYSAEDIVHKARVSKRKKGTEFVGIDYLQKMRFPGKEKFAAVSDAAVQLAKLAKSEYLAVMLLSSLTEKNGSHRNSPPTMQDLRMSGDIQYEASTIYLIHREIDEEREKVKADGQIIQAKGRSDEGGAFNVHFNGDFLAFE